MSQEALLTDLAALSRDPLRFVLWAFPWGEPGPLSSEPGPEEWQVAVLTAVRDGLLSLDQAILIAVASGHGVGKSALVAWLNLWALSTLEDTRGVVTANTENQLKTKTWAELGKWYHLFIAKDLFELTATRLFVKGRELTWRIDMVPWSEHNTEAFAGLHNQGRRVIVVMDEASAIPDNIHEVAEGVLTDANTEVLFFKFGNPTRNTGRFKECFPGGRFGKRWKSFEVDSRTVRFTNKEQIKAWAEDYGDDSDFFRIRVKGQFPRAGTSQFINSEVVDEAATRQAEISMWEPFIIGVDVARFGDDDSVIYFRKGRDGRTHPPLRLRPSDPSVAWSIQLAGRVAEEAARYRADAIFVDEGGVGAGVVDALRAMRVACIAVQFGSKADRANLDTAEPAKYANKRAEMWGFMRDWLKGGMIPDDPGLRAELVGPEYGFNIRNEIQLEKKEDMKKRGLSSPDVADALALTFAYPVMATALAGYVGAPAHGPVSEYDPLSEEALAA